MDHATALHLHACERYVLGELDEAEHDAFEEHYFSCPECAEDVRALVAFAELAGPVLATEGAGRRPAIPDQRLAPQGWRSWQPLAAAAGVAVLLGVAVYQSAVTVPQLRRELSEATEPQATSWHFLSVARAAPPVVVVAPHQRLAGLTLSYGGERPFPFYRVDLRDAAGATASSAVVPAPATGSEIQLLIPATLEAGAYTIVLSGLEARDGPVAAPELVRYPFTLVREER
jgi:hypothetical protein